MDSLFTDDFTAHRQVSYKFRVGTLTVLHEWRKKNDSSRSRDTTDWKTSRSTELLLLGESCFKCRKTEGILPSW